MVVERKTSWDMEFSSVGRQGGVVSYFRTRRKYVHVGLDETSLFHTVLK